MCNSSFTALDGFSEITMRMKAAFLCAVCMGEILYQSICESVIKLRHQQKLISKGKNSFNLV